MKSKANEDNKEKTKNSEQRRETEIVENELDKWKLWGPRGNKMEGWWIPAQSNVRCI